MKVICCRAAILFLLGATIFASPEARAEAPEASAQSPTGEGPGRVSQALELPRSIGAGDGKEVSVLLDESHVKLATITLRRGTVLPTHSTPVPATIQVLEGEGVIHVGSEAVAVSQGMIVFLAAGEQHDVVPAPGSDMLLLVHYLRCASATAAPPSPSHDH